MPYSPQSVSHSLRHPARFSVLQSFAVFSLCLAFYIYGKPLVTGSLSPTISYATSSLSTTSLHTAALSTRAYCPPSAGLKTRSFLSENPSVERSARPSASVEPRTQASSNVTMTVTAYCPCSLCCGRANQRTASGVFPRAGITLAAPTSIPFATVIEIPGRGSRIVQDRTSTRYGDRLDIFFATHQQAKQFGIQKLTVTIYEHN